MTYCAGQLRRHDYDRFLLCAMAQQALRPALLALYGFNLEIAKTRESVSEPMLGEIRLQWWREALDGAFKGEPRQHANVRAIASHWHGVDDAKTLMNEIIDARAFDLGDDFHESAADLEAYIRKTAGTLGVLTARCVGDQDGLQRRAEAACQAHALAGIMLAVPAHARMRRCLLPRDLMRDAGIQAPDLFQGKAESLPDVLRPLASRARELVSYAKENANQIPRPLRRLLLPASLAELALKDLKRANFDPFKVRVLSSPLKKQWVLGWRVMVGAA